MWPGNDNWMTAKECADWWRDLVQSTVDSGYSTMERNGVGADTFVGFSITWGVNSLSSAVDMFLFDPLRLGDGTGNAVGNTTPGLGNTAMRGLGVLADIGRAACFLPLGKLTRVGRAAVAEEQAASQVARAPTRITSSAPKGTRVSMPDGGPPPNLEPTPEGLSTCSNVLRAIFKVAPDAAPEHGICSWVALTQALRSTGRWYMRIEDITRLMGIKALPFTQKSAKGLEKLYVASVRDYSLILGRLGVPATELNLAVIRPWSKIMTATKQAAGKRAGPELIEMLEAGFSMQRGKGVILFPVEWSRTVGGKTEWFGHMLFARLDDAGKVVIYDRSGATVRLLSELEALYPGIGNARFLEATMDSAGNMKPGLLFVEDAVAAESKANLARAVKQAANDPNVAVPAGGLFGPIAIPVKLHLHLPSSAVVTKH